MHTDPGLALRTRKGTGFYKVPSLKGVWYRGHYLHDGSVGEPRGDVRPGPTAATITSRRGSRRPGVPQRAVPGHEFGLDLSPEDSER